MTASRSTERKIKRLTSEIAKIEKFFYSSDNSHDRDLYAGMLERKRDDVVRSSVLQMHTGIEDILSAWIFCHLLGVRPERRFRSKGKKAKVLRQMLFGSRSMGFEMKLNLAFVLRLLDVKTRERLNDLNTLRNRCSHNWLLKAPMRRGKRPRQKKPPLLLYDGRDLHKVEVLRDFTAEFGTIYVKIFGRFYV